MDTISEIQRNRSLGRVAEVDSEPIKEHFAPDEFPTEEDWRYLEEHPPANLNDLIARLDEIFSRDDCRVNVDYVKRLMTLYKSNRDDWDKYAKFDMFRYTRNLVWTGNGRYNLMMLCWGEGQGSSIHDHADSHCFLKLMQGTLKETQYDWPKERGCNMEKKGEYVMSVNETGYINDSIGLHRVENPSHTSGAVSLHLYSPPFSECRCFDEKTGKKYSARVTFWTKFGERTSPEKPESAVIPSTTEQQKEPSS